MITQSKRGKIKIWIIISFITLGSCQLKTPQNRVKCSCPIGCLIALDLINSTGAPHLCTGCGVFGDTATCSCTNICRKLDNQLKREGDTLLMCAASCHHKTKNRLWLCCKGLGCSIFNGLCGYFPFPLKKVKVDTTQDTNSDLKELDFDLQVDTDKILFKDFQCGMCCTNCGYEDCGCNNNEDHFWLKTMEQEPLLTTEQKTVELIVSSEKPGTGFDTKE